jgi:hypothetical protein
MTDNELVLDNIVKIVKTAASARMHSVLANEKIETQDEPFPQLMPGEWISLVLLSSNELRIFFKIFFDYETLRCVLKNRDVINTAIDLKDDTLKDFMREYCNLVGGYINAILEKLNIQTSMSLPLTLKGFDDFFFPYAGNKNSLEKNWLLNCNGNKFYCSCFIEILDFKNLNSFKTFVHEEVDLKEGDVDFL